MFGGGTGLRAHSMESNEPKRKSHYRQKASRPDANRAREMGFAPFFFAGIDSFVYLVGVLRVCERGRGYDKLNDFEAK